MGELMQATSQNSVRVVGCGRWMRRDDQVGLLVVEALTRMERVPAGIALTEAPGAELVDQLEGCDVLILVDAALPDSDHPAGTWQSFDYIATPERLRPRSDENTHTIGVESVLRLAAAMEALPQVVHVYAIAVADTRQGDQLTPGVAAVVPEVANAIAEQLRQWTPVPNTEVHHA